LAAISGAHQIDVLGHDELNDGGTVRQAGYQLQEDYRQKLVVVAAGEGPPAGPLSELTDTAATILGFADLAMQIRDNLESAFIDVMIAAPDRGNGIGAALARAAEDDLRAAGRSKLMSWTSHAGEAAADDPQAVVAPTGAGALSRTDPAVAFALAQGFVLEQTERHSQLELPVSSNVLDPLRSRARDRSTGYRVLAWQGLTPQQLLPGDGQAAGADERRHPDGGDRVRAGGLGTDSGCFARIRTRSSSGARPTPPPHSTSSPALWSRTPGW